jgi:hypothetical protein
MSENEKGAATIPIKLVQSHLVDNSVLAGAIRALTFDADTDDHRVVDTIQALADALPYVFDPNACTDAEMSKARTVIELLQDLVRGE